MSFSDGFFNAKEMDRTYTAEDFCGYLSSLICNGILDTYGSSFKLTPARNGLKVTLGTGKAWLDGHYFVNDASYTIDLTEYLDESLPRLVALSIVCDTSESIRCVSLEVTPGAPAEQPMLPSFSTDPSKTRLVLYAVRLNAGASALTSSDVTDYRENTTLCGYCKCILGKCKVTDMQSQLAILIARIKTYNDTITALTNKVDVLQTKVDDLTGDIVETGSCGASVYYVLYANGKLLLRGTGATNDYDLGASPFWENDNIRELVVGDGITAIGNSLLERCGNLTSASFPNTLRSIGERAFFMYDSSGLQTLHLPSAVTTIGEKAFANNAIADAVLPQSLTSLGAYLFMDSVTLETVRVECAEIPAFCFSRCVRLHTLTLSRNVQKLGAHMVNYCAQLTEITYEGSLEDWAKVTKSTNWDGNHMDTAVGTLNKIVCLDGSMVYDREQDVWTEVHD